MDISQYLDLFISEAQDHLQKMNQTLLALEENPDDLSHLDAFFRAAHTLKGMSATLGFNQMASLSHHMEDLLDVLRKRERRLTPELANILFRCLDTLTELLQGIVAGKGEQVDTTPIKELLHTAREEPTLAAPAPPPTRPDQGWEVQVQVAPDCALKGPRAFLVLKRLKNVASVLGTDPSEDALRSGNYEETFLVFLPPEADPQAARQAAATVAEIAEVTVQKIEEAASPAAASPEEAAAPARPAAAAVDPVVRIKVSLLDRLLDAVANLVINRSHLVQVSRKHALPELDEVVESHTYAMGLLQEAVLAMRMTPVGHVFNRFPRMVRDIAHQQGKEVRFEMDGLHIELDRTILDKITDPLVHILRNAVDHGIEPPEERQQAGKSSRARILLSARRERDTAIIEVRDDGQGMSRQRIARLAVERGIITEQQAGAMDDAAIYELICLPGFSTREQATNVSGRGVGMEVVKEVMDEIGGVLEIESEVGQGSCFRLIFPLTMAIIPALLVRVGDETYAMPLTHILRTIEPLPSEVRQLHDQPILWSQEKLLPLASLADLLGAKREANALEQGPLSVVVVERGRQRYGLVVDEILGKEDIVLKPLESMLQDVEGLAGATIRGEGEVTLVLDIPGLARLISRGEGAWLGEKKGTWTDERFDNPAEA